MSFAGCSATSRSSRSPGSWLILVLTIELSNPGIVSLSWASVIMRAAVPLAILAGCQTLCMLTGGIDLSVGAVASMAGFVTATLIHTPGGIPQAILVALAAAALAGLVNGIAVGVFRVHPLIVTLGMSFIVLGLANVWQLQNVQTGSGVPDDPANDRLGDDRRHLPEQPRRLRPGRCCSSS